MKKIEFSGYYFDGHFELSEDVKDMELKSYFETILKENNISSSNKKEQLQSKIEQEHMIYPGGITFYDNNKVGTTGCCFDLNDIKEACKNILNSNNTWLGHDPDMIIKFVDENIIFFESEGFDYNKVPEEDEKIEYTKEQINFLIADANNKLKGFIDIFYNYLNNNFPDIADILIEDMKKLIIKF